MITVPLTETEFQRQVVTVAEQLGWDWLHIGRVGKYVANGAKGTLGRGWPDLFLVRGDRIIVAELKAQKADPTPQHQLDVLNKLAGALNEVYVWRPSDLPLIVECLQ